MQCIGIMSTLCTCKGFCGPVLIHSLNWNPIDMQLKLLSMLDWHNQHSVNSKLGVNKCLQCQLIQLMQYSVMHMSWSTLGWLSTDSWSRVDKCQSRCWLMLTEYWSGYPSCADWGNKSTLNYRCLKTAFLSIVADEMLTIVSHNLNIPLKVCASLISFSLTAPTLLDSTFSFIFFDL